MSQPTHRALLRKDSDQLVFCHHELPPPDLLSVSLLSLDFGFILCVAIPLLLFYSDACIVSGETLSVECRVFKAHPHSSVSIGLVFSDTIGCPRLTLSFGPEVRF